MKSEKTTKTTLAGFNPTGFPREDPLGQAEVLPWSLFLGIYMHVKIKPFSYALNVSCNAVSRNSGSRPSIQAFQTALTPFTVHHIK